jgi:hypothetical protein
MVCSVGSQNTSGVSVINRAHNFRKFSSQAFAAATLLALNFYGTTAFIPPKHRLGSPVSEACNILKEREWILHSSTEERRAVKAEISTQESVSEGRIDGASVGTHEENLSNETDADPVCRIVAASDGKLPTSPSMLPTYLSKEPHLLRRLDGIYHAMAHDETRQLKYMADSLQNKEKDRILYSLGEERNFVSVTRTSLEDAGFELLSRRDLDLCDALNAGYLLRLSILPELSRLDPSIAKDFYPERFRQGKALDPDELLFDGRVLVYWRGYDQEVSRGRLLLPKIDYLQASLVQRSAAWLKDKLDRFERILYFKYLRTSRRVGSALRAQMDSAVDIVPSKRFSTVLRGQFEANSTSINTTGIVKAVSPGNIIRLNRYGGSKIKFVGSPDPNAALTPFVFCEQNEEYCGPCPRSPQKSFRTLTEDRLDRNVDQSFFQCNSLSDSGLKCPYDIEQSQQGTIAPPSQLLKRVTISNLVDFFTRKGRRSLLKTLFSKSELVEPTYKEVFVVWRPLSDRRPKMPAIRPPKFAYDLADMFDIEGLLPKKETAPAEAPHRVEIRAFSDVPMANLPAVLPSTKLVFRPADAFVFDFISFFSFFVVFGSLKFDNPKLDLLAVLSVSLWLFRTFIRYSNKLARYDLLVKKFLTSKITHRNSGALKYIATEAGSQRATRAALVHSWLSRLSPEELLDATVLAREGTKAVNNLVRGDREVRVDMDASLNDLEDLGLISRQGAKVVVVTDDSQVVGHLKRAWNDVFDGRLSLKTLVGRRHEQSRHESID